MLKAVLMLKLLEYLVGDIVVGRHKSEEATHEAPSFMEVGHDALR